MRLGGVYGRFERLRDKKVGKTSDFDYNPGAFGTKESNGVSNVLGKILIETITRTQFLFGGGVSLGLGQFKQSRKTCHSRWGYIYLNTGKFI